MSGGMREAAPFELERLGVVLRPLPEDTHEARGVLNPAAARARDGTLYLFPRAVDAHDRSRILRARVVFDNRGDPVGAERLGTALEPRAHYELRPAERTGGCEDPRITYIDTLNMYVMAYSAWGTQGARVALAHSTDLQTWHRLGLIDFEPHRDRVYRVDFDHYYNKDGMLFPEPVTAPDGRTALALLHRPVYGSHIPDGVTDPRPAIWISYCPLEDAQRGIHHLRYMRRHRVLIEPRYDWEELYIGGSTPPVRTPFGWLVIYHGVRRHPLAPSDRRKPLFYSVGVLVLDLNDPRIVRYRSPVPILEPQVAEELDGGIAGGVVPTGIDDRRDGRFDVYYGMADTRIGVARLRLPERLP